MEQRIHFISLGCPKNRVDTEVMLGVALREGYRLVSDPREADTVVINTCGFIEEAKEESIETILEIAQLKGEGSLKRLIVAGCLVQRYGEELAQELPEVDHFLGSSDMLQLERVLRSPNKAERLLIGHPSQWLIRASDPRVPSLGRHSVYVKIAEGCSRRCAFCAIPQFRGKQRSRPIEDIVLECERLVSEGAVEINLVSQDTIAYGRDLGKKEGLASLVSKIAEIQGLRWVRIFYLYPECLDPALVELFASHPRVLPYIDMPFQHASDAMLRRMRRGHTLEGQKQIIYTLRERIPHLVFRSAVIVGHPGESEADFEALLEFVRWAEFDRLAVFTYSHEEGTASYNLEDDVPPKVKRARARAVEMEQRSIMERKNRALIGKEVEVLVEGPSSESEWLLEGRWWGQAPEIDGKVILANGTAKPGEIRKARITHATPIDLVADLANEDGVYDVPPEALKQRGARRRRLPTLQSGAQK
ncbi:MAG: 30S ribosomal protein S12 methylthiotransferase RimO [Sandaracinaceae bacterium]|nr:30S ribosomal protein S12 methylthiotransferase RimO [Sandaracinaceae bacterium]